MYSPKVVEFDKSIIESYQADENFNYFKNLQEESAWNKFKRWLSLQYQKFMDWVFSGISEGNFWNYLAFVLKLLLILGLILLVAWLFSRYYIKGLKPNSKLEPDIDMSNEERLIQKKDLTALIKDAEAEENYRLATRYLFLNTLKYLKDYGFIDYQYEKTNADYQFELQTSPLKAQFEFTSRFYEFVWYGDFNLNSKEFQTAKTRFENMILEIQNTQPNG